MADVNVSATSKAAPLNASQCAYKISNIIDFNDAVKTKGSALVSTDVIQALYIPAKTFVQNVFIEILTAATATTLTATVSDGTDVDGFDGAVDFEAVAGTITCGIPGTDDSATTGEVYATANTIDLVLTVSTVSVWPKIKISALCFDLS